MLHQVEGRGQSCFVSDDTTGKRVENLVVTNGDTITITDQMMDFNRISYTYKTSDYTRNIPGTNGNAINHTTKVWTIAGANGIASDVGGTLTVSGFGAGVDGTYTITVSSGTSITTSTAPVADHTFTSSVTFQITAASLQGTVSWLVNNDKQDGDFGGQINRAGLWVDATSDLSPAPAAITGPVTDWIQADDLSTGWSQFKFTASAGQGQLSVFRIKKGNF
jgi:hypothetical protein